MYNWIIQPTLKLKLLKTRSENLHGLPKVEELTLGYLK